MSDGTGTAGGGEPGVVSADEPRVAGGEERVAAGVVDDPTPAAPAPDEAPRPTASEAPRPASAEALRSASAEALRPATEATRRGNVYLLPSATASTPVATDPADPADQHRQSPGLTAELVAPADRREVALAGPDADQPAEREDWAWVQEWRAGAEPTPWTTGVALTVFSALVVGVAVWVLSAGLADRPIVAVLVNLLVAAGLAPAIWLSRDLPVLRWIAAGAASGIVIGWLSALMMLPMAP